MIGVGDIYDSAGEFISTGEYAQMSGTPIDDDITLSDYVTVGLEEELGVEEDLGLSEELGDDMLKTIPSQPTLAAIPERSFTKEIRRAGPGYDKSDVLYGGIFGGGF
jgi:hypothetical protein